MKTIRIDYQDKIIYLGIDVHKRTYSVTVICEAQIIKRDTITANPAVLVAYLNAPLPPLLSEAFAEALLPCNRQIGAQKQAQCREEKIKDEKVVIRLTLKNPTDRSIGHSQNNGPKKKSKEILRCAGQPSQKYGKECLP